MRAIVQRVHRAQVRLAEGAAAGEVLGSAGPGLLVLLGIGRDDTEADGAWLLDKIVQLRVFPDPGAPPGGSDLQCSLQEIGGDLLIVSQFTLYGDCRKGRRPSFTDAMPPQEAEPLYERCVALARARHPRVATGRFRAMMHVELVNDGPVTLWLDSRERPRP